MNVTSIEHFKRFYPNENIANFDKIYYTQSGEETFAFILVKGQMEDIKVFTQGNYDEASLEKRIFMLISKYGKRPSEHFSENLGLEDNKEELVRYDLLFPKKRRWGETVGSFLFVLHVSILEILALVGIYLVGTKMYILLIIALCCLIINIIMFFIFKKKTPHKKEEGI